MSAIFRFLGLEWLAHVLGFLRLTPDEQGARSLVLALLERREQAILTRPIFGRGVALRYGRTVLTMESDWGAGLFAQVVHDQERIARIPLWMVPGAFDVYTALMERMEAAEREQRARVRAKAIEELR